MQFYIKRYSMILFSMYVLYLVYLIATPLPPLNIYLPKFMFQGNIIPFKSIYESLQHFWYIIPLRNIGGNILLFVPFGFLAPLIWKKLDTLGKTVLAGFLVSFTIELLQLTILAYFKTADIDDVLLNTFGTMIPGHLLQTTLLWISGNG